jgi:formylglycine-generating enzyme required for sulfatase activity
MENQRRTFISYSRSNQEFVVRLTKELRAEGFPVWLDILDIPAGSRWDREVEKALKESDIFMIILTQSSAESENVLDEIGYAIDHRKRIMPVLMEKCEIPLRLTRFQYVDFTNKNFEEGIAAAKDLLKSLIEQPTVPNKEVIGIPQQKDQVETGETAKSKSVQQTKEDSDPIAAEETKEQELARQRAEEELAVKARVESEQKVKEKAKPVEVSAAKEPVPAQKNPLPKAMVYGIGVVVFLLILSIGFNALSNNGKPNAPTPTFISTKAPVVTKPPTREPEVATKPIPTNTAVPILTSSPPEIVPTLGIGSTSSGQDGMRLLYVPAGDFIMGSNDDSEDEKPVHTVKLSAFWIDQTEVTNEMYQKCVEAKTGACTKPGTLTQYADPAYAQHPVVFVSWQQAVDYCSFAGRRLPTEAEWEKAARGDDANVYPWGNQPKPNKNLLNSYLTSIEDTTVVGSYPKGASPYSAFDMAGNVLEWVNDWFDKAYYSSSPSMDPTGPGTGDTRVLRGGSWQSDLYGVTTYHRASRNPKSASGTTGFRCALSADALP